MYLLLGSTRLELFAAGAALGLGLGAKLTTVFVWPVLALLLLARGRRAAAVVLAGAGAGFATFGCWGYVLNIVHTGRPLGDGGGRVEVTASPSFPGSLETGVHMLYRVSRPRG
jgi:hypothetical protein